MGDSYNQHWRINSLQIVENSLCLRSKCTVIFEKRELVKLTMWKFRANLHMHPEFTEYLLTIHWQAVYFWVVSQAKRGNLDMTYENYLYSVQRSNTWRNYKLRWVPSGPDGAQWYLRGAFGFLVLRFWLFLYRFFGFVSKTFVFSVLVFIAVCGFSIFLAIGFRFSRKIPTGFRIWYPMRFSVFPNWPTVFGFRLLFDLSGNITRLHWSRETQTLLRGMRDKLIEILQGSVGGFTRLEWRPWLWPSVGVYASWMTPKTLTLQCGALRSRSISLRTMSSNVPNAPATEDGQLLIVSRFSTKRGKAARISERKTSLDAKLKL